MQVQLAAIPETMLWTLHNRACESLRDDAFFRDPHAERIYEAIDYPFERHFGPPDASHAARALVFDEVISDWLQTHPGGTVVELGCGLETQCLRLDDGAVQWLSVDLPEVMALRERFIEPTQRRRHCGCDVRELGWMDQVDADQPVFVSAQGLMMYLSEDEVRALLQAIVARFPGGQLLFDTVPPWAVLATRSPGGYWKTSHYRVPAMHWGVGGTQIAGLLREWLAPDIEVRWLDYPHYRALPPWYFGWIKAWPWARDVMPGMVHVVTEPAPH